MLKSLIANPTFLAIVNGQLRHYGGMAGAALVTHGVIDGGPAETIPGIFVAIGALVLSALAKRV
jgi:hypothetical protein